MRGKPMGVANTGLREPTAVLPGQGAEGSWFDHAQNAVCVCDMEDRAIYWNHAAERLYGWTSQEIHGRSFNATLCREHVRFAEAKSVALLDGGWTGELHQRARGLGELIVECHWTLMRDAGGAPTSILMIHSDVTRRRQMHASYLRCQRSETIAALGTGMAHYLNNTLQPITLAMGLVRRQIQDSSGQEMVDVVVESALRAAAIVGQVQAVGQRLESHRAPVSVAELAQRTTTQVRATLPVYIQLLVRVPEALPPLWGNLEQLHEALLHLSVNARDAMPSGGALTLRAGSLQLSEADLRGIPAARSGLYLKLSVSDSGTGIPEAIREKIFEPYFTTRDAAQSTGLGLCSVLAIVSGHEGFLTFKSREDHGSTFDLFVPAARELPPVLAGL